MGRCRLFVVAALFAWVTAVPAQPTDDGGASPYFDCPYVNYFDADCPQVREQRVLPTAQGRHAEPDAQPGAGHTDDEDAEAGQEGARPRVLPEELILFPRESLAPDAPPLFRILLAQPTLENARRYVRWHARRTARLQVVQALIQRAGEELEANTGLALRHAETGR